MLFRSATNAYRTVFLPEDIGQAVIDADATDTLRPQYITDIEGGYPYDAAAEVAYPAGCAVRSAEDAAEWRVCGIGLEEEESLRRFAADQLGWP